LQQHSFATQQQLAKNPLVKAGYILYRRLREQGLHPTGLWLWDKIQRRVIGFSPPPVSRVRPLLYVGGQHRAYGLARMRAVGITAIVNLRAEADDAARGVAPAAYLWLPTPDDAAPTPADLTRGAAFIAAQVAAGCAVYIHCASGVGRAPTMAAAYLISTGVTPGVAWTTIRCARPFIRPTPPQLAAIAAFKGS